ncbi:branched-chain amino acid transport system ATP-binding protein [Bradyrhizobium sp. LB9.1b]
MPLLEAAGVKKIFGKLTALDGAALTVGENEFHGLIGPNGSGKSTLMKCIAGAEVPTQGKVSFVNTDITAFTPTERARAGMSLKFQITSVLPSLTLYDNILLALQAQSSLFDLVFSRTRGALHDQVMTMLTQFRLADRAFDAAAALSHGQQQWLEIAMALAGKPKLLLLDEPTGGMSLEERRVTGELLQPIKKHCSLVIVEHDLDFIRDICDRLTVLDQGKVLAVRHGVGDPGQQIRPGDLSAPCLNFWTSSISTPAMAAARSCSTSTWAFPGAAASPCSAATALARPR